jgi:hypothetical protein
VKEAIEFGREHFKGMPTLCGILNVSSAYLYRCVNEGEMSLRCALKFELITDGKYQWRDLAPSEAKNIDSVMDRATNLNH